MSSIPDTRQKLDEFFKQRELPSPVKERQGQRRTVVHQIYPLWYWTEITHPNGRIEKVNEYIAGVKI